MNDRARTLSALFLIIACIFSSFMIFFAIKDENRADREVRAQLGNFSSNMLSLAQMLDDKNADKAQAAAEIIKEAGDYQNLSETDKSNVSEFLSILSTKEIVDFTRMAAYARLCSLAALKTINGERAELGSINPELSDKRYYSDFEIRETVKYVKELLDKDGITARVGMGEVTVSAYRSNMYVKGYIAQNEVYEHVYLGRQNTTNDIITDQNSAIEAARNYMTDKRGDAISYTILLNDEDIIFVKGEDASAVYIIGVSKKGESITHYKKQMK